MFMPALRPPHTVPAGDDRLLQIRSRRKIDLERLRNELLPELGETIQIPHTDYEYRAYCTHEQWASAMALAAMRIDYVKFKEQSEKVYGDVQLHNCYTAMWGTVFTKLSTKKHQAEYWSWQDEAWGRGRRQGKNRKAGESRWTGSFSATRVEGGTLRDLIDSSYGITSDDIQRFGGYNEFSGDPEIDAVLATWDDSDVPKVTRRPDGKIDHSHCDHGSSKAAKQRCRRRNRGN